MWCPSSGSTPRRTGRVPRSRSREGRDSSAPDRPRETGKGGFEYTPFEIALAEHAQVGEVRAQARAEHAYDYGSGPEAFLVIGVADAAPVES